MTRSICLVSVTALSLAACAPETSETAAPDGEVTQSDNAGGDMTPDSIDVVEAASANGKLSTFLQVATSADIGETLAQADGITVFAPINEAFEDVEGLEELQQDRQRLVSLIRRHAIPSTIMAGDIAEGETEVETLSGETLTITNDRGQIMVTGPGGTQARVVEADIDGDNGVVHAINTVLTD